MVGGYSERARKLHQAIFIAIDKALTSMSIY
jgi:hypothetical protein